MTSQRRRRHHTTVYLTDEQRQWLRRAAAKAQLDGLTVSASDLIRLAVSRLQEQVSERQLHQDLVAHALAEPSGTQDGAMRGLPTR
jgi:Arc/MetJ-type ribon-helix-helix transcriptional regulator